VGRAGVDLVADIVDPTLAHEAERVEASLRGQQVGGAELVGRAPAGVVVDGHFCSRSLVCSRRASAGTGGVKTAAQKARKSRPGVSCPRRSYPRTTLRRFGSPSRG